MEEDEDEDPPTPILSPNEILPTGPPSKSKSINDGAGLFDDEGDLDCSGLVFLVGGRRVLKW